MAIEQNEVKDALEKLHTAVKEQRELAEKRFKAIEAGQSTSDFDEKIDRVNDTIQKFERTQREWLAQQDKKAAQMIADDAAWKAARIEEERKFEARINRAALGLGGGTDEMVLRGKEMKAQEVYNKGLRKGFEKLNEDEVKVLTVASDPTGGYLAPPQYEREIIKALVLSSPMRGIVGVRQSSAGELQLPKRTQTAAATWMGEVGTRSETQNPNWGLMKIPAHELYAEARISMANLEDSAFNLEAELAAEFGEQFGVAEGAALISGNGVGKPLGFLDANAAGPSTPIDFTVSGGATTIAGGSGDEGDGLVNLFHAVKTGYASNGRWLLNRNSLGKVRLLKDTQGRYLWQPGLTESAPATILGAPYTECPDMPNEGSGAFPIAFGDWKRAYTLVDRTSMVITRDPYTLAANGQVKFSARRRVGGQVILGEAIRLLKCST